MASRRSVRRFIPRRRRRRWETLTILSCRQSVIVPAPSTCTNSLSIATALLSHTIPFSAAPERYLTDGLTRNVIFGGAKFQAEHIFDPALAGENMGGLAFMLTIWEALMILPLAQGASMAVPLYVPNLGSPVEQGNDFADRVLWKRISMMPLWGTVIQPGVQLMNTMRDTSSGPQVVKARAKLDERHGLFYVRSFVHDIVGPDAVLLNIQLDMWWKLFVRRG